MITYIVGDHSSKIPPLEPHPVKNTVSVNQARRVILRLSQPLAEIAQLIEDNVRVLKKHKTSLSDHKASLEELKDKLYVPMMDLRVTQLAHPATVCASLSCTKVHQVTQYINFLLWKVVEVVGR